MKSRIRIERLKRLLNVEKTTKERSDLLKIDSVQRLIYDQWQDSQGIPINGVMKEAIWTKISERCSSSDSFDKKRRLSYWWYSIAAVALFLIGIGAYWLHSTSTFREENIHVIARANEVYVLPDGSRVFMYPRSELTYPENFKKNRMISLKGNALFDVQKDKKHPFRVHLKGAFIEVKGTSFLVKQTDLEHHEIMLFTGSIAFNVKASGKEFYLKPMQKINYNSINSEVKTVDMPGFSFKDGRYNFVDIPLKSLVDLINEIYGSTVILETQLDANTTFTGSIRYDETLEDVLGKICFSLNLTKKHLQDKTVICLQ
ncbi:MAG: FecR family protein [Bacteroidia bacterium]|nr:FecR family protein [Bacteroidia bacterium]